jgi:hypothetical protein
MVYSRAYISDITCPEIHHGESFMDRKSVFQGHIAAISHTKQVFFTFLLKGIIEIIHITTV